MIDNKEFGYTPNNLKSLRKEFGLTQTKVAEITGIAHQKNIVRWEYPLSHKDHADMPYCKWVALVDYCKNILQKK